MLFDRGRRGLALEGFNVSRNRDGLNVFEVLIPGALTPGKKLLDCPVIGGSCVSVADRDRKKFKELFACRRPGARDDGGSRERFLRNNGKFGKRAKPRDFFDSLGTSAERANGAVLRFARFAPPSVAG